MRYRYGKVFKAQCDQEEKEQAKREAWEKNKAKGKDKKNDKAYLGPKLHTMTYQCNLLPSMKEEAGFSLLNALANSTEDQLDIFEADVVRDLIDYKW